jgi:ribosomal protein S18 acetylase RimI-like enzyme
VFRTNHADAVDIARHLLACDDSFVPRLTERADIAAYAAKIAANAERFEAWSGATLVGLVAAYCGDQDVGAGEGPVAFVTNVSVLPAWRGKGLASALMRRSIDHAVGRGCARMELVVDERNAAAVALYARLGFRAATSEGASVAMTLALPGK